MILYNVENKCPKCGMWETEDTWWISNNRELIERICTTCRYIRQELPLDSETEYIDN